MTPLRQVTSLRRVLLRLDPGADRLLRLSRLYAIVSVPALCLVLLVMGWPMADGHHDLSGATLGHDLSHIWVAGRMALSGHAAAIYDIPLYHRRLVDTFGADAALFAWHYPPVFLLVAAALAMLPLPSAILAWGLASILLMAGALRAILGKWRPVIIGLAFPSIFECLGYGQNGLLTASLLAFGLVLPDRRPYLAGTVLGLLCYKPQLAVLAPILMMATGRWRVVGATAASAIATMALSAALFGPDVWTAFLHSLPETNVVIFQEAWGSLALNASAFGAVRLLGGSLAFAWVVQIVVAALAVVITLRLWLRPASQAMRNAVLLAAIPLVSPYVPVYDLAVLVPAGGFFIVAAGERGGLQSEERIAILTLAALAFDPRGLTTTTHLPCGWILAAGAFALATTGARRRAGSNDRLKIQAVPGWNLPSASAHL